MAAFYIDQIVKGRVCGTFVILGFRRLAGVEHAQLKEYDQAQPGRCRRGELALPLDALQPVLMTRSACQVVVFTRRGDYWNYTGDRVREIADFMDLTVTKNGDGRAMVGIPEHARKEYASTLRNAGINITFDGATD